MKNPMIATAFARLRGIARKPFIVNLKAAKELGLELPPNIIASATELRQ